MRYFKILFLFIGLCFALPQDLSATHIVGGEMRYRCLGGNFFRIYLTMRRDCFNGAPNAQFDDPAYITVFGANGEILEEIGQNGVIALEYRQDDTLNEILTSTCEVIGPDVCVHTTTYFTDVELRPRSGGYLFVYQRCCYNSTLVNIEDPLETGLTLSVQITDRAYQLCNTSPDYRSWPSIYLCQGDTFSFDHSARDVNRDSLVYELCAPWVGASLTTPKPTRASTPPYDSVTWKAPYDLNNLMGGVPLRLDPQTGLLTGAPNTIGQFLVGVCLREYRDGVLLSESRRVFEYNIRECPERPIADFETDGVICDGFTVEFRNTSAGQDYLWYFDYDNDRSLTSTDSSPTFVYSAPGIYKVGLFAIRDQECRDSVFKEVVVYGDAEYKADFDFMVDECEEEIVVTLEDKSFDNLFGIEGVEWRIEGKDTVIISTNRNEMLVFEESDTLTIRLIATTEFGCTDTIVKVVPVNILDVEFLGNQISICNGDSTFLVRNPNPNFQYVWLPPNGLSCIDCPNPLAYPTTDMMYTVIVTDGLCTVRDTVRVTVNESLILDIEGDTIACQEQVDLRIASGVPANAIWATDRNLQNIIATGTNEITVNVDSFLTVFVMSSTTEDCQGMDSINIRREEVFFEADTSLRVCEGDTFSVMVTNLIPDHALNYTWAPGNRIISGQGSSAPSFSFPNAGSFSISFTAVNQFGCLKNGEIDVIVEELPQMDFTVDKNCDTLLVEFTNTSEPGSYVWYFGDGDTSHQVNPNHLYSAPGDYEVRLTVQGFCYNEFSRTINVGEINVELPDTVISCAGDPVELNPGGDPNLQYSWSPSAFLDDPNAVNPTATVLQTTVFNVIVSDSTFEDCFVERQVVALVTEEVDFSTIPVDTVLCYNDTLTLAAEGPYEYCWLNEQGDTIAMDTNQVTVIVTDEEVFTVVGKDQYDCNAERTVSVKRFNLDSRILQPDTICFGDAVRLQIENLGEGDFNYSWTPTEYIIEGENTSMPLVSPDVTTTFFVEMVNEFGCIYFDSVEVVVDFVDPVPEITSTLDTVYLSQSAQLDILGKPYTTYSWSPPNGLSCTDCPNPIATPENDETYKVVVTNDRGCKDSAFYNIVVIRPNCDETDVYVPNAFSPNGDNINDFWRFRSNFVDLVEVYVYNRWGEKVFESTDVNFAWDGTYNGEFLKPDVYAYYIRVVCVDASEYTSKGNLTLMR